MSERDKKITAITAPFPGAKRPLQEGAKLGWWEYVELGGDRRDPVEIPLSDIYIFGAWHPGYDRLINDLRIYKEKQIIVMWTSSVGEVDLCPPEQYYLPMLLKGDVIDKIWFGDIGFNRAYPEKSFYARYPLCVDHVIRPHFWDKRDTITLMCPSTSKKNILAQLLAVKLLQDSGVEFVLETNIEGYDWVLKDINHRRHSWLEQSQYNKVLGDAKVNLAVSHCETFNYQVAEAALLGTPSVISPVIPLTGNPVKNTGSVLEIATQIEKVFTNPVVYAKQAWEGIIGESLARNNQTRKVLEKELLD